MFITDPIGIRTTISRQDLQEATKTGALEGLAFAESVDGSSRSVGSYEGVRDATYANLKENALKKGITHIFDPKYKVTITEEGEPQKTVYHGRVDGIGFRPKGMELS